MADKITDPSWQSLMDVLSVGAIRGMVEAYRAANAQMPGALPSLDEVAMYDAATVLAATLLEDSVACKEPGQFSPASRQVGRDVLAYLKALRRQREDNGEATLVRLLEKAGLERHRTH